MEDASPASATLGLDCVKALNAVHLQIRRTLDAVMASKDVAERLQAAEQLSVLQHHFNELAQEVQHHAEHVKQCSAASASCIAYDGAANQKAMHCLKLEQQAGQLDRYISSRSYGRLHPRYKLGISSS